MLALILQYSKGVKVTAEPTQTDTAWGSAAKRRISLSLWLMLPETKAAAGGDRIDPASEW